MHNVSNKMLLQICLLCLGLGVIKITAKVTDAEYALMPPVFYYDDFNRCMLSGSDAIYCSAVIELSPVNPENVSKVWNIIEEESRPATNFKHYKLRRGICIWQSCSQLLQNEDFEQEGNLRKGISKCYIEKLADIKVKAEVTEMHIQKGGYKIKLNNSNIFFILCVVGLGFIIGWGTLYEGLARYKSKEVYEEKTKLSTFGKLISSFSLLKNWDTLLSPFSTEDAPVLKGIQGVRVIAMFSIVCLHTSLAVIFPGVFNTRDVENIFGKVESIMVLNNTYSCQAFLVISAFLLAHQFFLIFEKEKSVKLKYLFMSFVNRYIRLTPCLIAFLILVLCTNNFIETGPVSYKSMENPESCQKNWWANILYINNYYDTKHVCGDHIWYLATDIQLYMLLLVLLGIIWKFPRLTRIILGISLTVAILIPIVINYVNDYDIILRVYPETVSGDISFMKSDVFRKMYIPAHTNMGASIIGLIFAYLFHTTKKQKIFTKKLHIFLWYILVIFPPIITVCLAVPMYADDYANNRLLAALYVGVGRNAVSFSIALYIYGVSQGIGWFFRDILFWAPLQVMGKLCYCTYLFHVIVVFAKAAEQRYPSFFQPSLIGWQCLGDLTTSFLLALIVSLCVEMPFQALQKMYIPQINGKKKPLTQQVKIDSLS